MSENDIQLPMIFDVDQKIKSASKMSKPDVFECSEASGEVISLSDYASEKESARAVAEKEKIYQSILNRVKHLV